MGVDADAELLAALRRGSADALAALVRRHQGSLQRAALQVLRDPADAQDVVQEAFLRVCRGREMFRGEGSVRGWLYRITLNLAIDLARRRQRQAGAPVPEVADPEAPDPLEELVRRERAAAVRAAVADLPLHHRLPLVLREWHDLSYDEIAAALRIPVGTVRSRLHVAREALRGKLEPIWRNEEARPR